MSADRELCEYDRQLIRVTTAMAVAAWFVACWVTMAAIRAAKMIGR